MNLPVHLRCIVRIAPPCSIFSCIVFDLDLDCLGREDLEQGGFGDNEIGRLRRNEW
jgi:hypothetical protein